MLLFGLQTITISQLKLTLFVYIFQMLPDLISDFEVQGLVSENSSENNYIIEIMREPTLKAALITNWIRYNIQRENYESTQTAM